MKKRRKIKKENKLKVLIKNVGRTAWSFFQSKKKLSDENFSLREENRKLIEREKQLQILNVNLKRESQDIERRIEKKYSNIVELYKKSNPQYQEKCQELSEFKKWAKDLKENASDPLSEVCALKIKLDQYEKINSKYSKKCKETKELGRKLESLNAEYEKKCQELNELKQKI